MDRRRAPLRLLFTFALLALALAWCTRAQSIVECYVDCAATPDLQAAVDACLEDQATLCNDEIKIVPYYLWAEVLGFTEPQEDVTDTYPALLVWQENNSTAPRVDCDGLINEFSEVFKGIYYYMCVQTTYCYIDPTAEATVVINGTCAANQIAAPGIGSIAYVGGTFLGCGVPISPYVQTQLIFEGVTFDGGGCTAPLLADCMLNSNLTMIDVTISGFQGDYVLRAEACAYDVWVDLRQLHIIDAPGTALYFEGLWGLRIYNLLCERCAQRNDSECVHVLMSPASNGVLDIQNPECWRIADLLPPRCRYCLTGDDGFCGARCDEGEVEVYDRRATEQFANCPLIDYEFIDYFSQTLTSVPEFEPICRVWSPPTCNFVSVADSQNFTRVLQFGGGDILWDYDAPLLCVPGGDVSPLAGPFFLTGFDNGLGDPAPVTALPPLPTPPAFVDPGFEQFGTNWTEVAVLDAPVNGDVLSDDAPQPPRTGDWLMRCDNNALKSVRQLVQAPLANVGANLTLTFYARRREGQRYRYAGRFVRLLFDGVEQDRIEEPEFSDTLVNENLYYQFTLEWTPLDALAHELVLECDFRGGANGVTLHIDDVDLPAPWAGAPLLDPSFEEHALAWTDVPFGDVVLPQSETPCNARSGTHLLYCGIEGADRRATQQVVFLEEGVYAVEFWAERRNSIGNYDGLSVSIVDGLSTLSTLPVTLDTLPSQDDWHHVYGQGGIVVSSVPTVLDLGFRCDFTAAPGGAANLCIDDVQIVAIGTIGVAPSTLGFSSQVISSMPYIVNQTCDCDNYTAPMRNATTFPCAYALDNATLCIEEEPACCFTEQLYWPEVMPFVMCPNASCCDLNAPCVFLANCAIDSVTGELVSCHEYTCPYNLSLPAVPLGSVPNAYEYLLEFCTEHTPNANYTQSLLYPGGVAPYSGNPAITAYDPPPGGLLFFSAPPTAYWQECPLADDPLCLIYVDCLTPPYFDPLTETFTVLNCTLVNCTAPSGLVPLTQAELAACPPATETVGNVTTPLPPVNLTEIEGAWIFHADGSAVPVSAFSLAQLFKALLASGGDDSPVPFFQLPPARAALGTGCPEPRYWRDCPCVPAIGNHTVPANATNDDPSLTDTFYTCIDGVASCRCNDAALDTSSPPPPGTIAYHIVVAPDSLSTYRFINARSQQYAYGQVLEQVSYELQVRNTIAVPHFFDDRARCRLSIRNDNEFCRGTPSAGGGDCAQGNIDGPYTTVCNILNTAGPGPALPCMMWYGQYAQITSEAQFECLVDDRATDDLPGFGSTIFNTISEALDGCGKDIIGVRYTRQSSYFEENLEIEKANRNILLISLEEAYVVGQHTIGTNADNITIIGFKLEHPADNRRPLFDIEKAGDESDLNDLVLLNNVLEGSGCRKCGVVDTKRLDNFVMNYTQLNDWQFFAVKLDDVERVVLAHDVFNATVGRTLLIRYEEGFVVDQLAMIDARGGEDLKGAAISSLTAKRDDACDESDETRRCLFRHVHQLVGTTNDVPRFRDACFYFSRGSLNASRIYDNACRLGQNGFIFLKTINIGSPQLVDPLMLSNPLVRPHLFQLPDEYPKAVGTDYVIRTTTSQVSESGDVLFTYDDDIDTDYDQAPFLIPIDPIRCQSNINWSLRNGFGTGLGFWPEPGRPRMGVEQFHNATVMVEYCEDRREVPPVLGGDPAPAFVGRVRSFNGSRITPERLSVYRDAWLRGDDTDACCRLPHWPPALDGVGHRLLTRRLNLTDLAFCMPAAPTPHDMWSSGPLEYDPDEIEAEAAFSQTLPNEVCLDDVLVDGRSVLPPRAMWAFRLLLGEEQPPEFFETATNAPPPPAEALLVVRNTTIRDFVAFDSDRSPDGFNFLPGEYPHANGLQATFFNRLEADTEVRIFNLTVRDVDATGLRLLYANNYTVQNSSFFNCSGRALGNEACVTLIGNDVSELVVNSKNFNATEYFLAQPAALLWADNDGLHTTDVLFPRDDRAADPGWVAHFEFLGFPNTTDFCVLNGSTQGLPLGIRYQDVLNETLLQCSRHGAPPPDVWPDLSRYLRAQCLVAGLERNEGTYHDLAFGRKNTDRTGETYFCDSDPLNRCCPLIDPSECYVVQAPELLDPANPWLGQFVFASLNDAIVNCNATKREIVVVGSDDVFRTGDTSDKVYTEVISATVPLVSVGGVPGKLTITATTGVTWRSVGNRLATQCVPTELSGFQFEYAGPAGAAIWDQTGGPADDACGLRLTANRWLMTADGWALRALVGDHFVFEDNTVRGQGLTRRAVEVRANGSCTDVGVRIDLNRVTDVLGVGIDVQGLNCPSVANNDLDDVGGADAATLIPYALRVGVCDDTAVPLAQKCARISGNKVRSTQVVPAAVGRMATCWLGPVPRDQKQIRIRRNDCRGLDFGMRFEELPNCPAGGNNPKQTLRELALTDGNVESKGAPLPPLGQRFDLVCGAPADDVSLITDPNSAANKGRWCTEGCPRLSEWILWSVLIALGLLAAACIGACLITGCCTPRSYMPPDVRIVALQRQPANQPGAMPVVTPFDNDPAAGSFPRRAWASVQQWVGAERGENVPLLRQRRAQAPAPTHAQGRGHVSVNL